jgi:hypothetical protein
MVAFDQAGDIFHPRANPAQQIPAHHPQSGAGGIVSGTAKSHGFQSGMGSLSLNLMTLGRVSS